jgi:hypothetical protein
MRRGVDVRDATHVQARGSDQIERIVEKWGIGEDGTLAKPSAGGLGVITEAGKRIEAMQAWAYFREEFCELA